MPELSDIVYSQEATIEAFRDYYQFLTKMYLKESDVREPPKEGWPSINTVSFKGLEKDDAVIELLRHLPYIGSGPSNETPNVGAHARILNWNDMCEDLAAEEYMETAETYKLFIEDEYQDAIPSSVVGITDGGYYGECILLDTKQGAIYWPSCNGTIKNCPASQ